MAAKKETTTLITIKPLVLKDVKIRIVPDAPLITHNWSEKALREMLDKQTGKKKAEKKPTKMPFDDFARSLYWITEMPTETIIDEATQKPRDVVTEELFDKAVREGARFGFPADSIKQAACSAAYRLGFVKSTKVLGGAFYINADDGGPLLEIKGCVPMMREDPVRIQMTNDIRYRGHFENWYMDATLQFNASGAFGLEDIINCINAGGYACGIGEWRPEKNGRFGRFHVELRK